jgi:ESS family glutamate:Na+ symporter
MLTAIITAAGLLLIGLVLRAKVRWLQVLFVPASVIGGIVGLGLVQGGMATASIAEPVGAVAETLRGWPGPLIAVVFAGLLLEHPKRTLRSSLRGAVQAGIYAWIVILGQIVLGLAATWLLIAPARDVPPSFGQLLEAGFAGGHGTATALGAVFTEVVGFPDGFDLGLVVATVGLLYSVISGIVLVNIAVRRGWTRSGRAERELISGMEQRSAPSPMAFARVRGEVIDPLAFQLVILAMAFGLGTLLRVAFVQGIDLVDAGGRLDSLERLPLFLFTLLGGWMLRGAMTALGLGDLIDGESIKRLVAIAMEFLIVAAIASLRVEVIGAYFWPLAVLCGIGFAWTGFCLVILARRLLPPAHWFELGIINYGMSTGTTAQGLMLLRIIDRDLDSGAAEDYALAAPLSAPFIGGGVITMTLPVILQSVHVAVVVVGFTVVLVGLFGVGRAVGRRESRG